jgi:hypothetical protein
LQTGIVKGEALDRVCEARAHTMENPVHKFEQGIFFRRLDYKGLKQKAI